MSEALDRIAADVMGVDPRLRLANDMPDCFLCGRKVRPEVCYRVESDAFHAVKAHGGCINIVLAESPTPLEGMRRVYARARVAMLALYTGKSEGPAPGADIVRGHFL